VFVSIRVDPRLQSSLPKPATSVRYGLLVMLFVTVVINYLDRSNLSVAAIDLGGDLKLDARHMGLIFSAFGWAYALLQIPGGWLVDRFGPRALYATVCGLWSLATILQGFAGTFVVLFSLRLLLGAFEAPAFPICNRLVTTWFPDCERAGAIGCYTSGQFVGLAFLTPLLVFAQKQFGWQAVFILTGGVGLLWAALWYLIYREPTQSRRVSASELDYIRRGGGLPDIATRAKSCAATGFNWPDLAKVLGSRKLWGIYLGQFAVNSTLWFFLTWFPKYLVEYRHLDFIKAGFLASLPFLAAFCGVVSSGLLSDGLIKRGVSPTTARKVPIISGLLLSTSIIGANYVDKPGLIVLFLALAFFGNGFASITWVLVSSLAPERLLGLTGGVFNFIGNLASIVVPITIGRLIHGDDFAPALVFIGAIALMGALSYIFLVGKVERVQ
jgi:ACS family D-galactonate transporter-like MFS transporter